ncbi:hypothetical protein [Bacillus sp. B4EP4a]|uniref:hypothetical protein n=1 Tax=Bacillus sp. B4EP4a TaxID=2590665 RepID=UPI00115062E0|nr:hypothetical protein [Bacillus sp. B4EP4a]
MRNRKFFIAKVNIHGNIFEQNLQELISVHIPRVLLDPKPLKINTWNWAFTDVELKVIENNKIIFGNVTKSKLKKQKYKDGARTIEEISDKELAETAFFVYDPESELLVHESNTSISAKEFRNFFTILLGKDPYVGEVILKPIPIPYKIKEELKSYDKVTRIAFHLIHPNPGKSEFNLFNKIINDVQLKELDIEMQNNDGIQIYSEDQGSSEGLNEIIEEGILLVEKGYGDIDLSGYNEQTVQGKRKMKKIKKNKKFRSAQSVKVLTTNEIDKNALIIKIIDFMRNTLY